MRLRSVTSVLAGLTVLAGLASVASPAALAQSSIAPVIEYKSEGGFVLWNFDMKVYSSGFTIVTLTSPRQPGESLFMYDYLGSRGLAALKSALDRANFTRLPPTVRTRQIIMDVPDRIVKYRGKTVRYTTYGSPRAPVASAAFVSALGKLGDNFSRISDEPLVKFQETGGIAFMQRSLTITRAGQASYEWSFGGGTPTTAGGRVDFATVNELKRLILAADWWNLPSQYPPNPAVADGTSYSVSVYNAFDRAKSVASSTGAAEDAEYSAVVSKVQEIIRFVNP